MAGELPSFEPPVGDNGFAVAYADRLKTSVSVEPSTTLAQIYRRAIDQLEPRASKTSHAYTTEPLETVHWAWFYEPADKNGIRTEAKAWEIAEDLIVSRPRRIPQIAKGPRPAWRPAA